MADLHLSLSIRRTTRLPCTPAPGITRGQQPANSRGLRTRPTWSMTHAGEQRSATWPGRAHVPSRHPRHRRSRARPPRPDEPAHQAAVLEVPGQLRCSRARSRRALALNEQHSPAPAPSRYSLKNLADLLGLRTVCERSHLCAARWLFGGKHRGSHTDVASPATTSRHCSATNRDGADALRARWPVEEKLGDSHPQVDKTVSTTASAPGHDRMRRQSRYEARGVIWKQGGDPLPTMGVTSTTRRRCSSNDRLRRRSALRRAMAMMRPLRRLNPSSPSDSTISPKLLQDTTVGGAETDAAGAADS